MNCKQSLKYNAELIHCNLILFNVSNQISGCGVSPCGPTPLALLCSPLALLHRPETPALQATVPGQLSKRICMRRVFVSARRIYMAISPV